MSISTILVRTVDLSSALTIHVKQANFFCLQMVRWFIANILVWPTRLAVSPMLKFEVVSTF